MRGVYLVRRSARCFLRTNTTTAATLLGLRVGDALRERRRFTEGDVAAYAGVTGDRNPVHLDDALAREVAGFRRGRVVHGMLVASLFPALIAAHFPGAVYASQSLKFAAPVYVGDEVLAQVKTLHIRETAGTGTTRYIVKFATKCFTNAHAAAAAAEESETLVIDGEAMAVLPTLHSLRPDNNNSN